MAETELTAREIYVHLNTCLALFVGRSGKTEADQAVIDLIVRDLEIIQAAMELMLAESRPQNVREP